jgi:XTP/dITP diphosphohydrolase
MRKIVFATNNDHKLKEVRAIMPANFEVVSLAELGCTEDIPETADSLDGNALLKARYIHQKFKCDCFADDTGLEVDALNGEPGVFSARYAGDACNSIANMQKLLRNLSGETNRNARFRTVIALILDDSEYLFEGVVNGSITQSPLGNNGFGYDPVFIPEGYQQTFAELGDDIKNAISHRAKAVNQLANFLTTV